MFSRLSSRLSSHCRLICRLVCHLVRSLVCRLVCRPFVVLFVVVAVVVTSVIVILVDIVTSFALRKNKAPVVEKPGSYAARFAARKGLLSKHMSQRQPAVPHQNIDTTLLQQQQQQQQMQQEIATSQYPSYSQIPVYGYNSNYGQYPYMGIGVTPASQGIQQEMPMNGNVICKINLLVTCLACRVSIRGVDNGIKVGKKKGQI